MSPAKFRGTAKILSVLITVFLFSCQKKEYTYFEAIAFNDVKLSKPQPDDWRYSRNENFQTFEDFQKSKKIKPEPGRNIIYLQPIGSFNELQKKEINLTREYISIYFQLDTKILPAISNLKFPVSARRIFKEGQEQILAGYVLDSVLVKTKPKDAVALMGITERDLFPSPKWNYVFGQASYEQGVAVTSIYRFSNGSLSALNFNESLLRLMKISSHEIGHMFGITHCLNANCVMNGTNTLSETDTHFARACSLCQQKLNSSLYYDHRKRLLELKNFFEKQHLNSEFSKVEQDLHLLH